MKRHKLETPGGTPSPRHASLASVVSLCISGFLRRFLPQPRASGGRPAPATTHLAGLQRPGTVGAAEGSAEAWRRSCGQEGGDSSRRWAARPGRWRRARPGLGDPAGYARLSAAPGSPSRRPAIRPHSARAAEHRAPRARSARRGPGGSAARLDPSALLPAPASLRRASRPETLGRSTGDRRTAPGPSWNALPPRSQPDRLSGRPAPLPRPPSRARRPRLLRLPRPMSGQIWPSSFRAVQSARCLFCPVSSSPRAAPPLIRGCQSPWTSGSVPPASLDPGSPPSRGRERSPPR